MVSYRGLGEMMDFKRAKLLHSATGPATVIRKTGLLESCSLSHPFSYYPCLSMQL